jgi:hypothetical protein
MELVSQSVSQSVDELLRLIYVAEGAYLSQYNIILIIFNLVV